MGEDAVSVRIKRQTALELLNALAIALGVSPQPYKNGKKKKDGGGKKYDGPQKEGKLGGKLDGKLGGKSGGGKKYDGPQKEGKLGGKSGGKPKPYGKR